MTELEKMLSGALYRPGDPELAAMRARAQDLMRRYNSTIVGEAEARDPILAELFGALGPGSAVRAPVYVDYGCHIEIGADCFFNFGCVMLDVCPIRIGDNVQVGPNVQLLAADHPRDAESRDAGLENGRPVTIGRNVWIGAAALILPGVTVGDDAIVGAGAVVTRDVHAGARVAGNPARVLPAR
ncbi:sugar O-acetyltransferase [Tranquillimonas rosea]|uniref:sugar O-acetyltransferase n=1 Tax=Tranquillimonas rosea TaxID=641238 RepID=UPI003BAD40CB